MDQREKLERVFKVAKRFGELEVKVERSVAELHAKLNSLVLAAGRGRAASFAVDGGPPPMFS